MKKFYSSQRIDKVWIWKGYDVGSNIFFAAWIESVMTKIFDIPEDMIAWFIPHLMANSLTSVLLMFTMWWRVLTTGLLRMYICTIDVVTLFLTLASVMTSRWEEFSNEERARLSSWQEQEKRLFLFHLLKEWKEKQLEKESIILQLRVNSGLRGLKAKKTLLNLLSMSTTRPLIDLCWCFVRKSSDK